MFNNIQGSTNTFDITEMGHIERITVGSVTPDNIPTEEENQQKMALVNRCLTDFPKGRIIGIERSFSVIRIGEHQVVLEVVIYHIGFKKAPIWLTESKTQKPAFKVDSDKVGDIITQYSE